MWGTDYAPSKYRICICLNYKKCTKAIMCKQFPPSPEYNATKKNYPEKVNSTTMSQYLFLLYKLNTQLFQFSINYRQNWFNFLFTTRPITKCLFSTEIYKHLYNIFFTNLTPSHSNFILIIDKIDFIFYL